MAGAQLSVWKGDSERMSNVPKSHYPQVAELGKSSGAEQPSSAAKEQKPSEKVGVQR